MAQQTQYYRHGASESCTRTHAALLLTVDTVLNPVAQTIVSSLTDDVSWMGKQTWFNDTVYQS